MLHIDGSRNVGGAGVGVVLTSPMGNTASRAVRCNFKATNNESKYEALIAGLNLAHQMGRSRSAQPHNRSPDLQVPVDLRNHSLRGRPRDRHRQWTPVHKRQLQGVLQGLGHKTNFHHTPTPPV